MVQVCNTSIDNFLWDMRIRVSDKGNISYSESLQCVYPLDWYVSTGRAPLEFLEILLNTSTRQKNTIAKYLANNGRGSHDAIITKICKYLKFDRLG